MSKRMLLGLAATLVISATAAHADISINWFATAGFFANGSAGNFPADGIQNFNGNSTIAQLIWSPDNTINAVDPNNGANSYVSGNDLFLGSFSITNPPSTFGEFSNGSTIYSNSVYGQTLESGFVYVRVFQDTTPASGEHYYDSPTLATTPFLNGPPPSTAQALNANTDTVNGNELNKVIVPEPTTLAFMGIGSLLVAIRRRSQKS